jgi:hypothetical protein
MNEPLHVIGLILVLKVLIKALFLLHNHNFKTMLQINRISPFPET